MQYYTTKQIALLLGVHEVSLRRWRQKNKKLNTLEFGPPYVLVRNKAFYGKDAFMDWCKGIRIEKGIPMINLPNSAVPELKAVVENFNASSVQVQEA